MDEKVKYLYQYFYQLTSKNKKFQFIPREREQKMIDNFLEKLTLSHDSDWLFNYFCFQFGRYSTMKTRFDGKIMLGWVIGKKSLQHFRDASSEELYWGEKFRLDFAVKNPLKSIEKINLSNYSNQERERFYNTERGLIHCKELNLFQAINKFCMFCKNKEYCK